MYIHNLYSRTAYRFLTAVFLLWGILLHFSCTDGDVTSHNVSFFTVQSNILCLVCFLLLLRQDIRLLRAGQDQTSQTKQAQTFQTKQAQTSHAKQAQTSRTGQSSLSCTPETAVLTELKFTATLCIVVTFLGNHAVVLLSSTFTGGILGLPMKSFLAHYAAPALVVLDWLFFTPKGRLHACSPILWMFAPALYLLFTALRALCCSEEALARAGKYPYFFLNVDQVGARVYLYIGIYFVCFLMVGYLLFFADRILGKIPDPLRENSRE